MGAVDTRTGTLICWTVRHAEEQPESWAKVSGRKRERPSLGAHFKILLAPTTDEIAKGVCKARPLQQCGCGWKQIVIAAIQGYLGEGADDLTMSKVTPL